MLLDEGRTVSLSEMQEKLAAEGTNLSVDAVRRRLERAHVQLRAYVDESFDFELDVVEDQAEELAGDERRYFLGYRQRGTVNWIQVSLVETKRPVGLVASVADSIDRIPVRASSVERRAVMETADGGQLVVRIFDKKKFGSDEVVTRFHRWLEIQKKLDPKKFSRLEKVEETSAVWLAYFRRTEGMTLREQLTTQGELPPDESLEMVRGVGQCLHELDEYGLMHGELRPENIIFGTGCVLTNLSIFHNVVQPEPGEFQQLAGAYLAPEFTLNRTLNNKSDVFSLGVVLLEAVCGRLPDVQSWRSDARVRIELAELSLPEEVHELAQGCLRVLESERKSTSMLNLQ